MEKYFVINTSEDGDVSLSVLTKEELEGRLNEDYWGRPKFLDASDRDLREEDGLIIIRGKSIQPKPRTTVKEWEV